MMNTLKNLNSDTENGDEEISKSCKTCKNCSIFC